MFSNMPLPSCDCWKIIFRYNGQTGCVTELTSDGRVCVVLDESKKMIKVRARNAQVDSSDEDFAARVGSSEFQDEEAFFISPKHLLFSQDSVSPLFSNGTHIVIFLYTAEYAWQMVKK